MVGLSGSAQGLPVIFSSRISFHSRTLLSQEGFVTSQILRKQQYALLLFKKAYVKSVLYLMSYTYEVYKFAEDVQERKRGCYVCPVLSIFNREYERCRKF